MSAALRSAIAASAMRVPTIGDLLARPPASGTIVNREHGLLIPAFSYNPRRDAWSRRKWARDTAARFAQVPRQAFLTVTLPAEWHGRLADHEMLAYEAKAVRLFKQSLDRLLRSMCSKHGRCVVCISKERACAGHHRGRPFHPTGRCAQCGRWRRLEWWQSRWVFACSDCLSKPRLPARPKDRVLPGSTLSWVREMTGKSGRLDNPHRHCRALMPYVPQDVLSRMAEDAGLGEVCDVRVDREATAGGVGELDAYLLKQGRMFVPGHPMLSSYFAKQAAEPDAFNALPERAARVRVNYPVVVPEKKKLPEGSFFALGVGVDEARRRWLPWTLPEDDPDWWPAPTEDYSVPSQVDCSVPAAEELRLPLPRPPTNNPRPL
jgi:hypothetical protein